MKLLTDLLTIGLQTTVEKEVTRTEWAIVYPAPFSTRRAKYN